MPIVPSLAVKSLKATAFPARAASSVSRMVMSPILAPPKWERVTALAKRPGTLTVIFPRLPGVGVNNFKSAFPMKFDRVIPVPTEFTKISPMPPGEVNEDPVIPAGMTVDGGILPAFTMMVPIFAFRTA